LQKQQPWFKTADKTDHEQKSCLENKLWFAKVFKAMQQHRHRSLEVMPDLSLIKVSFRAGGGYSSYP